MPQNPFGIMHILFPYVSKSSKFPKTQDPLILSIPVHIKELLRYFFSLCVKNLQVAYT